MKLMMPESWESPLLLCTYSGPRTLNTMSLCGDSTTLCDMSSWGYEAGYEAVALAAVDCGTASMSMHRATDVCCLLY